MGYKKDDWERLKRMYLEHYAPPDAVIEEYSTPYGVYNDDAQFLRVTISKHNVKDLQITFAYYPDGRIEAMFCHKDEPERKYYDTFDFCTEDITSGLYIVETIFWCIDKAWQYAKLKMQKELWEVLNK